MKNIGLWIFLVLIMNTPVNAQSTVVSNSWIPVLVNSTQYVPAVVPVTTYQTISVPVTVPIVQYYQVPFFYYGPNYQPVVQFVKPCYFCPGRYYYINNYVRY